MLLSLHQSYLRYLLKMELPVLYPLPTEPKFLVLVSVIKSP